MILKKNVDAHISNVDLREDTTIVRVDAKFDDDAAREFDRGFSEAHASGQPFVPVVIDSYGGYAHSLMSMVETIEASTLPVMTYAKGKAMSCGIILTSFGTDGMRYASPHCSMMLHQLSAWAIGKVADIEVSVEESRRLNDYVYTRMASACGKPESYFLNLIDENKNTDNYMQPSVAMEHGIVDHVASPSVEVNVDVTWSIASAAQA